MTRCALASFALSWFATTSALAHIQLDLPLVRYANDFGEINKSCPCGAGDGTPTCESGVTSDPNRDEARVTELAPSSTIVVRWRETVGHTGRFRVAFDDDGADLADFNAQILADIADPSDGGGERSVEVTLPSIECDNCTLQLIQDMNNNDRDPVLDPTGDATYFQCADLTLREGAASELAGGGCASTNVPFGATALIALSLLLLARRPALTKKTASRARRAVPPAAVIALVVTGFACLDRPTTSTEGLGRECPPEGCAEGQQCITSGGLSTCEIPCESDGDCPEAHRCYLPPILPGSLPNVCVEEG